MADNNYDQVDSVFEEVLQAEAYKNTDKWVSRRVRLLLHDIADTDAFEGYTDDALLVYEASFLSGYAARLDEDYNRKDTIADPAISDTKLATTIMDMLSGYQPYIQARSIHFMIENYPGQQELDDPDFTPLALFTVLGFANGFVSANSGEEDDEVKQKMAGKQLSEKQCENAATAAIAGTTISKTIVSTLSARIKELSDKELFPKSGVRKGYPITDDAVGVLKLYSTGYAAGAKYAVDVKDGRIPLATSKFNVPDYMKMGGRLWTTWCYRQQHSNLVRRASKDGWVFYLDKESGAIQSNVREFADYDKTDTKNLTRVLNNILAYNFMRGWTDGFADTYGESTAD